MPAPVAVGMIDAARIRRLRGKRGWSQQVLAVEAGLSVSRVSQLEARGGPVLSETLARLARALGCRTDDLLVAS